MVCPRGQRAVARMGSLGRSLIAPNQGSDPTWVLRWSPMCLGVTGYPGDVNPFPAMLVQGSPCPPDAERLLRHRGTALRICYTNE